MVDVQTCTNKSIRAVANDKVPWYAGTVTHKGKTIEMCWTPIPNSNDIYIIDETLSHGSVSKAIFKREET
jgi:hypothetical protein